MQRFARLLDALSFQYSRNGKLRLLTDYFAATPDPDRGFALAIMTGALGFAHAKAGLIRGLVAERVDATLFALSYDYVGDLAETGALLWPVPAGPVEPAPALGEVVGLLSLTGKAALPGVVAGLLDRLDATGRWAFLKLITGALRVGVSARLAKLGLAQLGGLDPQTVEEVWPAQAPPYLALFAWAEGLAGRPSASVPAVFRPVMLSHAVEETDFARLDPRDFAAEWKWDGIRVQAVVEDGSRRLYSRTGEDVGPAFPDLLAALDFEGVVDGELLIAREGAVLPFADLQKRLNRKTPTAAMMRSLPPLLRAYDLLFDGTEDIRPQPFTERRVRLERLVGADRPQMDISPLIAFQSWEELAARRASTTGSAIEGVMLKRLDSPYLPGRPKGPWWKWKRDPHLLDAVLMYAQRGHGKRSSFYSDYTFGLWREDAALVPVGKAYFGFTDEELAQLDRWVRSHTTKRFGPVREVEPQLVLEVAFEGVQRSTRHRSGLAMRFPRISRIRWDKPAAEADRLETLDRLVR